jgi:hypothetical protein
MGAPIEQHHPFARHVRGFEQFPVTPILPCPLNDKSGVALHHVVPLFMQTAGTILRIAPGHFREVSPARPVKNYRSLPTSPSAIDERLPTKN